MKKIKTKKKGEKYVNKIKTQLEELGWVICKAYPSFMRFNNKFFTKSNDFFGCIDIIAKKKGYPTRWIQATTIANKSTKEKEILQNDFWGNRDQVEIWCKVPRKESRIFRLCGGKFEEVEVF